MEDDDWENALDDAEIKLVKKAKKENLPVGVDENEEFSSEEEKVEEDQSNDKQKAGGKGKAKKQAAASDEPQLSNALDGNDAASRRAR